MTVSQVFMTFSQGFMTVSLKSSPRTFYSRDDELVDDYGVSALFSFNCYVC